jgi:hypothetical protein
MFALLGRSWKTNINGFAVSRFPTLKAALSLKAQVSLNAQVSLTGRERLAA